MHASVAFYADDAPETGRVMIDRTRKFITRPSQLITLFALTETVGFGYLHRFTTYP